jgi:AMMECR1 domain-containing protein
MDWSIGTHGLRISFTHHNRRYGSTYLPDVAREQGWTKEETMVSLMRKAGWNGRKDEWRKVELSVVRYQGLQVHLGYAEWRAWRDWVDEGEEV